MNKRKKFLGQYLVVVSFLLFVSGTIICGFTSQIMKYSNYTDKILELKKDIKNTDNQIKELKNTKNDLDSEKYIEYIARDKLKMIKSNEILYIDINVGSN